MPDIDAEALRGRPLTQSQRVGLKNAATGLRCVPAAAWEKHMSFATGETWFGIPRKTHARLTELGYLANDLITEAGREALRALEARAG